MNILNVKCTYHDKKDKNYCELNKGTIKIYEDKEGMPEGTISFINNEIEIDFRLSATQIDVLHRQLYKKIENGIEDLKSDILNVLDNH